MKSFKSLLAGSEVGHSDTALSFTAMTGSLLAMMPTDGIALQLL